MLFLSHSPETTKGVARRLAPFLEPGDLLALTGPLGAGKTCFTQGLAGGLGIRDVVASPSFVLARHYPGAPGLLHVDAYRLSSAEEFWELGLQEQLPSSVTVVEWAGNVLEALPEDRFDLALRYLPGENGRELELAGRAPRAAEVVSRLEALLGAEAGTEPRP